MTPCSLHNNPMFFSVTVSDANWQRSLPIRRKGSSRYGLNNEENSAVVQLSNGKNPGWLGYIGDQKLPSYIGIIIKHYKDPYTHIHYNGK